MAILRGAITACQTDVQKISITVLKYVIIAHNGLMNLGRIVCTTGFKKTTKQTDTNLQARLQLRTFSIMKQIFARTNSSLWNLMFKQRYFSDVCISPISFDDHLKRYGYEQEERPSDGCRSSPVRK
jgi:hypothetical protein